MSGTGHRPKGCLQAAHPALNPPAVQSQKLPAYLEVEDASVVLLEALPMRHHTVQELLVESKGANGSQQPAITWRRRRSLASSGDGCWAMQKPLVCFPSEQGAGSEGQPAGRWISPLHGALHWAQKTSGEPGEESMPLAPSPHSIMAGAWTEALAQGREGTTFCDLLSASRPL